MKLILVCWLLTLSFAASALPLISVKDQIREELWHVGLTNKSNSQQFSSAKNAPKPSINEEVLKALIKYKL